MKEHSCSESHMIGMTRWNECKIKPLDMADSQMQGAKARKRQKNKEIIFRLKEITVCLAGQGLTFRGRDESWLNSNRRNVLHLVDLQAQYDSALKLHLDVIKEKQASNKNPPSVLSNRTQNDLIRALSIHAKRLMRPLMCRTLSKCCLLFAMCMT